ncbi:MAG: S1 RNA-binding domain-containing protein, partial [Calditrichaeota bacterium]
MSWEEVVQKYSSGQTVEAIIEIVDYYGIFARLEDGTPGYVKRSEALYTDRVVDLAAFFSPHDKHPAVIMGLNHKHQNLDLSFKSALPDPLISFLAGHQTGDVVEGEVIQVTDKFALIEIENGVTGFLPIEELWIRSHPLEEVLMIEDRVRCRILSLEPGKCPLLSIRAMFAEEFEQHGKESTYTLQDSISDAFRVLQWELRKQTVLQHTVPEKVVDKLKKIALIDFHPTFIKPLSLFLDKLGFQTRVILLSEEQEIELSTGDFNAFILSIAAADSGKISCLWADPMVKPAIIFGNKERFVSQPDLLRKGGLLYPLVLPHSTETLADLLKAVASGVMPEVDVFTSRSADTQSLFNHQEVDAAPTRQLLVNILQKIHDLANATSVILFKMNINSREVDILAAYGRQLHWNDSLKTHLQYSPVKDVILDVERLSDDFGAQKSPQFKKLGNFASFIGQRIFHSDEFGYALFIFGQDPHQLRALEPSMLFFFELAIRSHLEQLRYIRTREEEQKFIISGKLTVGLMHELKNQLAAIKCYLDVLKTDSINLNRGQIKLNDKLFMARFERSRNGVLDISDQTRNIEELFLNLFRRRDLESINLVNYLRDTIAALKPYAEEHDIGVTEEYHKVPPIKTDKSALNQIIVNLFMNSVEFMPSVRRTSGQIRVMLEAGD